jgi:DnaJ-class molecular chaperone
MKKPPTNPTELKCPACNGTGFPAVVKAVPAGRKIYPAPCKECRGKGRIASRHKAAAYGTFETCRPMLPMSVHRGRPEVIGASSNRRV